MTNNKTEQASALHTLWLIIISCGLMADICLRSVTKGLFNKVTRPWVDSQMKGWTQRMLKLWKITCKVHNPKNVKPKAGQATILMCNHSSLFDIPLSYCVFPDISLRMLAKKELSKIPIMGQGMRSAEFPFVDRKNRKQAVEDLKAMHDLLESGIVMWIAPEGTRSADGKLQAFKKGGFITAIQTEATIIPIGIRGAFDIIPARTKRFYPNKTADIYVGDPIDASQFTLDNKEALIEKVHASMKTLVGESP